MSNQKLTFEVNAKDINIDQVRKKIQGIDKEILSLQQHAKEIRISDKGNTDIGKKLVESINNAITELKGIKQQYDGIIDNISKKKIDTKEFDNFTKEINNRIESIEQRISGLEESLTKVSSLFSKKISTNVLQGQIEGLETKFKDFTESIKPAMESLKAFNDLVASTEKSKEIKLKVDSKELNKVEDLYEKLNSDNILGGKSGLKINTATAAKQLTELYDKYNILSKQLDKSKDPKEITRLQIELAELLPELAKISNRIIELKKINIDDLFGGTAGKISVGNISDFTKIFDFIDTEIGKTSVKMGAIKKEMQDAVEETVEGATTEVSSFTFKKGGIRIPVTIDASSKTALETKYKQIISTLQEYADVHPVNVTMRLFPLNTNRADASEITNELRRIQTDINNVDDEELKTKLNSLYDDLEAQFKKALNLKIKVDLGETEASARQRIKELQDTVKAEGFTIYPTFDISEADSKAITDKLNEIQKKATINLNKELQDTAKAIDKLINGGDIDKWSSKFAASMDTVYQKLEKLQPFINSLANFFANAKLSNNDLISSNDVRNITNLSNSIKLLKESIEKVEKLDLSKVDTENFISKIQQNIDGNNPIQIPIEPDLSGISSFISKIENAIESTGLNIQLSNSVLPQKSNNNLKDVLQDKDNANKLYLDIYNGLDKVAENIGSPLKKKIAESLVVGLRQGISDTSQMLREGLKGTQFESITEQIIGDAESLDTIKRVANEAVTAFSKVSNGISQEGENAKVLTLGQKYKSNHLYRGVNKENRENYEEIFFTDSLDRAKTYGDEIREATIELQNAFVIDGKGKRWDSLQILGDGLDDNSKKAIELSDALENAFNRLNKKIEIPKELMSFSEVENETKKTVDNYVNLTIEELSEQKTNATKKQIKNIDQEITELEKLREAYFKAYDDYKKLSDDKSHPYGTYSTDDIVKYAKKQGYDGVVLKNIIDDGINDIINHPFSGTKQNAVGTDIVPFYQNQIKYNNQTPVLTKSTESEIKDFLSKKEVIEQLRTELNLTKKAAEDLFKEQGYSKINNKYQIEQQAVDELIASIKKKNEIENQDIGNVTEKSAELTTEEAQAMTNLDVEANKAAEAKKQFTEANQQVLSSIIESLKGLNSEGEGFANLNKLINNLGGKKGEEKVSQTVEGLKQIYEVLNQDISDNTLINSLNELASKGTDLENLATVLKSTKKEINNAQDALKDAGQDKLEDIMESIDVSGNAKGFLSQYGEVVNITQEIKKGFIQITSTVLGADDVFRRYTLTTKNGVDMVISKQEEHTTALEKEIAIYSKLLKVSQNLNKVNPNQTDEIFIEKDSALWSEIISYAKEYGDDLGNILSITRSVRQVNDELLESFKIVGEKGSVTIGAENDVVASVQNLGNITTQLKQLASVQKSLQGISDDRNKGYTEDYLNQVRSMISLIESSEFDITNPDDITRLEKMIADANELKQAAKDTDNILGNTNSLEKIRQKISDILNDYQAMPHSLKVQFEELRELSKNLIDTGATKKQVDEVNSQFLTLNANLSESGRKYQGMFAQMLQRLRSESSQLLARYFSFQDILRYARTAVSALIDLDTQLVDLRKTTSMTTSELNQFYNTSSDVAKELGVTTSEIISQASAWSRLGYSTKEASTEMAKLSSKFASVSPGMTTEQSTDYLVSTMQAYGIAVDDVERKIMDNVNRIGNTFATTNAEIGEMLTRSSAAMNAANNSLEETIALESAAVEVTRNAEMTGTAFRTVSMRIRGLDEETEEALEDYEELKGKIADLTKTKDSPGGVSLFTDATKTEYKSPYQFLKDIAAVYDQISDKNQANKTA